MDSQVQPRAAARKRTYYEQDVDFDELARSDPKFAVIAQEGKKNGFIDFQDPAIVMYHAKLRLSDAVFLTDKHVSQLTRSLLHSDFGLALDVPTDRLCPPVPQRWNYVHWLQELLDTSSPVYTEYYDPARQVHGLDIGVGASCIYGLLACASRSNWRMVGTDINAHSFQYANANVNANELDDRIKLSLRPSDGSLLPLDDLGIDKLDFVMTNPPFYDSVDEMKATYTNKQAPPSAVCTGADNEMICPGGDAGFISRILEESLVLRERVQWYSGMFASLRSVKSFVTQLEKHNINNFAVTTLQAGRKTKRWALAWSFSGFRPRADIARHGELVKELLSFPTVMSIAMPLHYPNFSGPKVVTAMKDLDAKWEWMPLHDSGIMECSSNVWNRGARRKKKQALASGEMDAEQGKPMTEEIVLAVKITCKKEEVEVRWLRGEDHVIFFSLVGYLGRTLTGNSSAHRSGKAASLPH